MNSLFLTSNGEAIKSDGSYKESSPFEPIPEGVVAIAVIEEATFGEYEGVKNIRTRWSIVEGDYRNRKIFYNLYVNHNDSQKRDRARNMLGAIDLNCGGNLAKMTTEIQDFDLASNLLYKPMCIKIGLYEVNDKVKNTIRAVSSTSSDYVKPSEDISNPNYIPKARDEILDDIPF